MLFKLTLPKLAGLSAAMYLAAAIYDGGLSRENPVLRISGLIGIICVLGLSLEFLILNTLESKQRISIAVARCLSYAGFCFVIPLPMVLGKYPDYIAVAIGIGISLFLVSFPIFRKQKPP